MIMTAVLGGLMATGCYFNRGVDETFETDRYTMRMVSWDMDVDGVIEHGLAVSEFEKADTMVMSGTVPMIALRLANNSISENETTLYKYDNGKQDFLPGYTYLVVDRDTTRPKDYTPLLHAMMEKGVLRADTNYEPMRILEVYDSARFASRKRHVQEEDAKTIFRVQMRDGEVSYEESFQSVENIAASLRLTHHLPVLLDPGVDPDMKMEYHEMDNNLWQADSLWLDDLGMRIVPDPQGRKMRVIEFNRCKGKI